MLAAKREKHLLQIRRNNCEEKFRVKRMIAQEYINITKTMEELKMGMDQKDYEAVNVILKRFALIQEQAVINLLVQHEMLSCCLELLKDYTYNRSAVFDILAQMVVSNQFINSNFEMIKQTFYIGLNELREGFNLGLCESVALYFTHMMNTNSTFMDVLLENSVVMHLKELQDRSLIFYTFNPIIKYQVNLEVQEYLQDLLDQDLCTPAFLNSVKVALDYKYPLKIEDFLLKLLNHNLSYYVLLLVPYCIDTIIKQFSPNPFLKKLQTADRKERPILIDILSHYEFDYQQTNDLFKEFLLEMNMDLKIVLLSMIDMRWIEEEEHNILVDVCLKHQIELPWIFQTMTAEQYYHSLPKIKQIQMHTQDQEILHAIDKLHEVYRDQY